MKFSRLLGALLLVGCVDEPPEIPRLSGGIVVPLFGDGACDCSSPEWTAAVTGSAAELHLAAGDALCLDSGVQSGNIHAAAGSSFCVDGDAEIASANLKLDGSMVNLGTAGTSSGPITATFGPNGRLDNFSRAHFGSVNFNGPATVVNTSQGTMVFYSAFALRNGATLRNSGSLETHANFDSGGETTFVNEGTAYVEGQLAIEGALLNAGIIEIGTLVNLNIGARIDNRCTVASHEGYNVDGSILNSALIYLQATRSAEFNITATGVVSQKQGGALFVTSADGVAGGAEASLRVDGQLRGSGLVYVEDETVCQGEVLGNASAPISIWDATPSGSFLDLNNGTISNAQRGTEPEVPTLAQVLGDRTRPSCGVVPPCVDDADAPETDSGCPDQLPVCIEDGGVRGCVDCEVDGDCRSGFHCTAAYVCEPDADSPAAYDDALQVAEGKSVTVSTAELAANDLRVSPSSFGLVAGAGHVTAAGGRVLLEGGQVTYTAPTDAPASDSFQYIICGVPPWVATCVTAWVHVDINRGPEPEEQRVVVSMGTSEVTTDVLADFQDPDGDRIDPASTEIDSSTCGAAGIAQTVVTVQIAEPDVPGECVVEYRVCDLREPSACGIGRVIIAINDPPTLEDVEVELMIGVTTLVEVSDLVVDLGVVNGDDPTDGDDDGIGEVSVVSDPDGRCEMGVGGIIILASTSEDVESCTVRVCEELPPGDPAVCSEAMIVIIPEDEPPEPGDPEAVDDVFWTAVGVAVSGTVAANDDPGEGAGSPSWIIAPEDLPDPATEGTLTFEPADGTFAFTPAPGFAGILMVPYRLEMAGGEDEATLTLIVNDPPELEAAVRTVSAGEVVSVPRADWLLGLGVVAGDDPDDGDTDGVGSVGVSASGDAPFGSTAEIGGGSTCDVVEAGTSLTLSAGQAPGTYTCTLQVCEELPAGSPEVCATTVVTLIVAETVQEGPDPQDDEARVREDESVSIPALLNDRNPGGGALHFGVVNQPEHGRVTIVDGELLYEPDEDYHGEDSFTYEACNDQGVCAMATVYVTVTPVNDPPDARDDAYTTPAGQAITLDVLANDVDPDGDALEIAAFGQPQSGQVHGQGDTLVYTPASGFFGVVTFDYTVRDPDGLLDTATVTVAVDPGEDTDGDGLSDDDEILLGTDVDDGDTDGDGVSDGDEVALGTDPMVPDVVVDHEFLAEGGACSGGGGALPGALGLVWLSGLAVLRRARRVGDPAGPT